MEAPVKQDRMFVLIWFSRPPQPELASILRLGMARRPSVLRTTIMPPPDPDRREDLEAQEAEPFIDHHDGEQAAPVYAFVSSCVPLRQSHEPRY